MRGQLFGDSVRARTIADLARDASRLCARCGIKRSPTTRGDLCRDCRPYEKELR